MPECQLSPARQSVALHRYSKRSMRSRKPADSWRCSTRRRPPGRRSRDCFDYFQLHFNCISTMNRGTRRVDKYDITQQEFVSDYTLIVSRMYSGITPYCRVFCSASQHASVAQHMHTRCTTHAHLRAVTGHISAPTCISWPAVSRASALSTAGAGAVTQKRDLNGACGRTQKTRARTLSEKSWFVGPRFRPGPRRSAGSLRGPGAARRRRLAPPGAPPCRLPAPERPPAG